MEAGNTHVADPVDAIHHEMDSAVHSHHVYKSVYTTYSFNHMTALKPYAYIKTTALPNNFA